LLYLTEIPENCCPKIEKLDWLELDNEDRQEGVPDGAFKMENRGWIKKPSGKGSRRRGKWKNGQVGFG